MMSSSCILIGIICGYILCSIMALVLPTAGVNGEGVEFVKSWVINWDAVANAKMVCDS